MRGNDAMVRTRSDLNEKMAGSWTCYRSEKLGCPRKGVLPIAPVDVLRMA